MAQAPEFDVAAAHKYFAADCFNKAWELLDQADRTPDEERLMVLLNQSLDYEAEVVDLNGDGQPEVFTSVQGTCLGGMAGVSMNLYIRGPNGRWQPQFGFPGVYTVLKTKNKGYPDIAIGGPGNCFPVWRWNGQQYSIHKKCR